MRDHKGLNEITNVIRKDIVSMICKSKSGHPGGSLSAVEILTALYFDQMNIDPTNPKMEDRDRFVLSKGHAAPALYATLAERGYFGKEELNSLRKLGSMLQGHPDMKKIPGVEMSTGSLGQGFSVACGMAMAAKLDNAPLRKLGSMLQGHPDMKKIPGVEMSTGSLGQGFSVACGMAMAAKLDNAPWNVYALLGDGEVQEGIIWEAAMSAAHYKLDNMIAFLDYNGLQIDGEVESVMSINPIEDKFRTFGWNVITIDGHDFDQIFAAISLELLDGM